MRIIGYDRGRDIDPAYGSFHASDLHEFFGFSNQSDYIGTDAVSEYRQIYDPALILNFLNSLLYKNTKSQPVCRLKKPSSQHPLAKMVRLPVASSPVLLRPAPLCEYHFGHLSQGRDWIDDQAC